MATYVVYFANSGTPALGLTPTWSVLVKAANNTAFTPQPAISELSGGWYKYTLSPTEALVGTIDGGISLPSADRYKSQSIPVGSPSPIVSGSQAVTFQVNDALSGNPIPDVECLILNENESLVINDALTSSMGRIQYQLNPGIYSLRMRRDGYNFTVPTVVTVTTGPVTFTYTGTSVGDIQADFRTVVVPRDIQY